MTKAKNVSRETIFALATPPGKSGVAIIRLSGPDCQAVWQSLIGAMPKARYATRIEIKDPDSKDLIDDALGLWFPGPHSFTGEDVVELQIHGSQAVLQETLDLLAKQPGCRLAEPGEFTKRAFHNNKLDLTAVEGLADLIDAETAAQRRQAMRQLQGQLADLYNSWAGHLIKALAHLEAYLDFPDEDLPAAVVADLQKLIQGTRQDIAAHLADNHKGERLRTGVVIAIIGPPNAGKSSLINALARRDVAIVTPQAGTTRDAIEVALNLGGLPATVVDTAGIRETDDEIEAEGVRRAKLHAENADLQIQLHDAAAVESDQLPTSNGRQLTVVNKIDLKNIEKTGVYGISVTTGQGLPELIAALTQAVSGLLPSGQDAVITRARHRQSLEACLAALERVTNPLPALDLAAEDLRLAVRALGEITGQVDVEDLLDIIFKDFCLGK